MEHPQNRDSLGKRIWRFAKSKWGIASIVLAILIFGYVFLHRSTTTYTFVRVTRGTITQTVSVTGNTTPTQSVSLGFETAGTIAHVYANVGDRVYAGQIIATLDTSDLSAQLKQAQATVDVQEAKLEGLQAGSRPEDIAASQAAAAKASQDLANYYSSVPNESSDGYAKANDAVHTQLSNIFSNADTNPQLNFQTSDSQSAMNALNQRRLVSTILADWQSELATTSVSSSNDLLDMVLSDDIIRLTQIRNMLVVVSNTVNASANLDSITLATYKTDVAAALTEVNAAMTSINGLSQDIASQKLTVAQANAELALKQAGSSQSDIDAQAAQVEQAQAAEASAQAKLANAEIVAPISGTITQMDAKVGQVASITTPLVSIISNGDFEVDAYVPETDIGKLAVGNPVAMTLDAFPGETFNGTVFYIDPAETIQSGVVDYKIKVSFNRPDPRIKAGLTVNLDIKTKTDDNVLIVPQYAIIQNDSGNFVETVIGKTTTTTPVTLGIQDENGNVEVLSGVTEGEEVVNIGLKQ